MTATACATCNCPSDLVRRVEVRPIRPDERGAWDALVAAHHYLGLRSLFGRTLRYVATVEGHWLALLGWQAAALNPSLSFRPPVAPENPAFRRERNV